MLKFQYPLLPNCFLTWTEPPNEAGEEIFRIVSWRRSLMLKGHSFREFARTVVPLLDGTRSFDEICAKTKDLFTRADLEAAFEALGAQGIILEAADAPEFNALPRLAPQINYLSEVAAEGRLAQRRLGDAKVAIFGMGGAGAALVRSLGAAGIGRIRCVDSYQVGPADLYFSALFGEQDLGRNRADCVVARVRVTAPEIDLDSQPNRPDDPDTISELINGFDLVISCLEAGELNLILKLGRTCRSAGIRWLAGALEGPEIIAGPGFPPGGDGPCYMCYRMRAVACSANPQSRFALERRLDRLKKDMSATRENLASGADILAGFLATETINLFGGVSAPSLDGRILAIDLLSLQQEKHVILRKPGCPVCGTERSA